MNKEKATLWYCPECGKTVDYGEGSPITGKTWCDEKDMQVTMKKVLP